MASRLSDKQQKKIIADYVELGSYNAVAKLHGISDHTVRKIIVNSPDFTKMCEQKNNENAVDVIAYMEAQKRVVCEIIGKGLAVLNDEEKLKKASPAQITTALGTLIDKWTNISGGAGDDSKEDDLSKSLRELGQELQSDDK